jgi:hypothetical protein
MKKIITYAAGLLITCSVAAAPGSKLIQAFKQTFPNAENVKWSDDKAGYFVSFYDHGNFEKVLYNKEGDFVSSWKYTDGKNLPTNIVLTLNKKYGESKILGVTELTTQTDVVYSVQLSKDDKLYSLQASPDGTILKEQKYNSQQTND